MSLQFDPLHARYTVCARAGDALAQAGRARLIWAANTAAASSGLGLPTALVASSDGLRFGVRRPSDRAACQRLLETYYGVEADFDIVLTTRPAGRTEDPDAVRQWQVDNGVRPHALTRAALVHTRDPAITKACDRAGVPFIYEDHSEDFHEAVTRPGDAALRSRHCRAVIAIAPEVKARLISIGLGADEVTVVESGVSEKAIGAAGPRAEAESWRRHLLGALFDHLVVYTGGMQPVRDIPAIIEAARAVPRAVFAFAGGRDKDVDFWARHAAERGVRNVRFLRYLPHDETVGLQRAADLLLYTRGAGPDAGITSPLKLFEYLAAGPRLLAAKLPHLADEAFGQVAVTWYNPALEELPEKIAEALALPPATPDQIAAGVAFAQRYTWAARQRRILALAGVATRGTAVGAAQ